MSDPFSILGLDASFDLSDAEIEQAYLVRAARAHPDIVGNDDESSRIAAELNDARARLLDPESRANAFLDHLGGNAKEQDRSLPTGFLIEMLETRERIQAAVAEGDAAQIAAWELWAAQERKKYIAEVSQLFDAIPTPLEKIRTTLNAWRYVERLLEQLRPGHNAPGADARGL